MHQKGVFSEPAYERRPVIYPSRTYCVEASSEPSRRPGSYTLTLPLLSSAGTT